MSQRTSSRCQGSPYMSSKFVDRRVTCRYRPPLGRTPANRHLLLGPRFFLSLPITDIQARPSWAMHGPQAVTAGIRSSGYKGPRRIRKTSISRTSAIVGIQLGVMLTVNHCPRCKVPQVMASRLLICTAFAALALPIGARAQFTGKASATGQFESNSNLFALESGFAQPGINGFRRSDTYFAYGAEFDGNYLW